MMVSTTAGGRPLKSAASRPGATHGGSIDLETESPKARTLYCHFWGCKKSKYIEKIALKAVQMEFIAIIKKISFDMFTVGNLQNIFREHDLYLISNYVWHKRKVDNFDPYYVLLTIATNIPMQLVNVFFVLFFGPWSHIAFSENSLQWIRR